jgi:glutamate decarboxylase
VAPFNTPELAWDFRLPLVRSINVSGHKYGLVYPGVGWVIWRHEDDLPSELIFHVDYLGGDQPTFNLNFSRGAGQVLAQYYNFLRLGKEGYTNVMNGLEATAAYLARAIASSGDFEILSKHGTVPLVCFRLAGGSDDRSYNVFDISAHLRQRGWIVPAYNLAPDAQDIAVLRVVVRENFSRDMADMLIDDLARTVKFLDEKGPAHVGPSRSLPGPARIAAAARPRRHPADHKGARGVC